jgi:hypothetical protein
VFNEQNRHLGRIVKSWPILCIEEVPGAADRRSGGTAMRNEGRQMGKDRASRIELIARVQVAYEQLRDVMLKYHDDSPRARAAIAAAKRRLSLLNRALALLALEVAQQPA